MKHKYALIFAGLMLAGTMAGCGTDTASSQTPYISRDSACATALAAAGMDADSASITSAQLSQRDDISYYAVDVTANGQTYSYSIDAVTGVIIEGMDTREDAVVTDSEHAASPTDYDTANGDKPQIPSASAPEASKASGTSDEITLDSAKQTALKHAGKKASEVTFIKAKKDFDDGQSIYEIEFVVQSGNSYQEYDYEISASTGAVLSSDFDAEGDAKQQASAAKTEAEARSIALAKVPGAKASDCSLRLDSDDGHLIYEGKIIYEKMEYAFEIDAYSGTILEWDVESIYD